MNKRSQLSNIRPATRADHAVLLLLWRRSVTASHHFLTEKDIDNIYQLLDKHYFFQVPIWVVYTPETIIGFIGIVANKIEMLFIDQPYQGQGFGKQLIDFAKQNNPQLLIDVNEQNPSALAFIKNKVLPL